MQLTAKERHPNYGKTKLTNLKNRVPYVYQEADIPQLTNNPKAHTQIE